MAAPAADLQKKKAKTVDGNNNNEDLNSAMSIKDTIVDPIYLIAQLSKIRDDFDSVKKIRTYLQKRDPTFQSGDAVQLINKIKTQIRKSVSHKYFTNQLRSRMNQLKQNYANNTKSHWMIPWFAVL